MKNILIIDIQSWIYGDISQKFSRPILLSSLSFSTLSLSFMTTITTYLSNFYDGVSEDVAVIELLALAINSLIKHLPKSEWTLKPYPSNICQSLYFCRSVYQSKFYFYFPMVWWIFCAFQLQLENLNLPFPDFIAKFFFHFILLFKNFFSL